MSAQITKRQYNQRKLAIAQADSLLAGALSVLESSGEYGPMNSIHDARGTLAKALRDLEHDYETQLWTAAEWNSWTLICNNID
jgi:hypothetical protein